MSIRRSKVNAHRVSYTARSQWNRCTALDILPLAEEPGRSKNRYMRRSRCFGEGSPAGDVEPSRHTGTPTSTPRDACALRTASPVSVVRCAMLRRLDKIDAATSQNTGEPVVSKRVAKSERMVEALMEYLKGLTVAELGELSQRLELRLYRHSRWIYLRDGRVSSQLKPSKRKPRPRCAPCCLAGQPKAPF